MTLEHKADLTAQIMAEIRAIFPLRLSEFNKDVNLVRDQVLYPALLPELL
jgi:hypothetical protein